MQNSGFSAFVVALNRVKRREEVSGCGELAQSGCGVHDWGKFQIWMWIFVAM